MPLSLVRCLLALLSLVPVLWWSSGATGAPVVRASGEPVRLQSHNADARDLFGSAVALSRDGRVLAVGADLEASGRARDSEDNSLPGAGAVYVFERDGRRWREAAYLKAPMPAGGAGFGFSVALADDGQTLAVGAPFDQGEGLGAVHLYRRVIGAWVPMAAFRAPKGVRRFGERLVLSATGLELAVSASQADQAVQAHMFALRAGRWEFAGQVSRIVVGQAGDAPATRLAMSGDGRRIALGQSTSAQVQLFDAGSAGWTATATLTIDSQGSPSGAVQALALSGDGQSLAVAGGNGRVAVHAETASGTWTQAASLIAPSGTGTGQGLALSANGQTLVVGFDGPTSGIHRFQRRGGRWYGPTTLSSPYATTPVSSAVLALSADGGTLAVGSRFEDATPRWPWLGAPLTGAGVVHLYSPA